MTKVKTRTRRSTHDSSHDQLPFFNDHISPVVLGAAAGCVIGAAAAFFLAPKQKRHKFTQGIDDIYDQITDAAEDYGHEALEKGRNAYNLARDSAGNICSAASQIFSKAGKNTNRNLILGLIGAGLLGASTVYALSQNSSVEESFADRWKTSKWSEIAKLFVDTVSEKLHGDESDVHEEHHNPVQNVIDWAAIGLNLWQEIKKRR